MPDYNKKEVIETPKTKESGRVIIYRGYSDFLEQILSDLKLAGFKGPRMVPDSDTPSLPTGTHCMHASTEDGRYRVAILEVNRYMWMVGAVDDESGSLEYLVEKTGLRPRA